MEAMVIEDPREIARPETAVPVEISDAIQSLVVSKVEKQGRIT